MELRRQLTGALAWAGLVLIIAVPSAELARAKFFSKNTATVASDVADGPVVAPQVKPKPKPAAIASTASVAPQPALKAITVPVIPITGSTANGGDAVKDYLAANKKLPDYITGSTSNKPVADAAPAQQLPAAIAPAAPTAVATIAPTATTPAPVVDAPAPVAPVATTTPGGTDPTSVASIEAQPVLPGVPPIPMPASARPKPQPAAPTVTEADLKDWKSGSLEDFLKAHGLLADGTSNTDNADSGSATGN